MFPETRQRSLEDINASFGEKVLLRYYDATAEDEKQYRHAAHIEAVTGSIEMSI